MSRTYLEDKLQIALVYELRLRLPPDVQFFHTPNGGERAKREAAKLKAMGVLPGIPDLMFLLPDGTWRGIELKVGRNTLTPEQHAFKARWGDRVAVCRSAVEVEAALRLWGFVLKGRAVAA